MATTPIISNTNSAHSLSIFMLPWVAHGHIAPFLELTKKLTQKNIFIYFCSTPINLTTIKNNLSGDTSNYNTKNIQLVELHLPSFPNLPPQLHTAKGLSPHLIPTLRKAVESTKPNLTEIWKELSPDVVILDIEVRWAAAIASTLNIPAVIFSVASVASASFNHHMFSFQRVDNYPFPAIFLRELEAMAIMKLAQEATKEELEMKEDETSERLMPESISLILVKSLREVEGKYINYYSTMTKKKVVPVGLLIRDTSHDDDNSDIIEWLDKKDKCSTVFASFGSECVLSKEEIIEIAHGLEQSGVNFIWFVRFPTGEKVSPEEVLPEGFLEKVKERGRIVQGWAPQVRILGHPSVGAFMCHSGWGSVMESVKCSVPIIAMPIQYDQPFTARLVKEIGVGLEVVRGNNGIWEREEVGKVVREVMLGKSGEDMRKKTGELMEKIKLNEKIQFDGAVEELMKLCGKELEK